MFSDLDIWRAANLLIRQHGADAELEAGRLQDLMLDRPIPRSDAPFKGTLQDSIDDLVRARIGAALDASKGNRAETARLLGIDRATLWRLMKRLGS